MIRCSRARYAEVTSTKDRAAPTKAGAVSHVFEPPRFVDDGPTRGCCATAAPSRNLGASKKRKEENDMCFRPATANANTVSCPMCGHENPISATQCEECGFAVSTPGHAPRLPALLRLPALPAPRKPLVLPRRPPRQGTPGLSLIDNPPFYPSTAPDVSPHASGAFVFDGKGELAQKAWSHARSRMGDASAIPAL